MLWVIAVLAEQFDLQQNDKYVVGPGSKLANGNTYDIMQDEPIAEFPDWLADWIEKSAPKHKRAECELAQVVDDFDIEDFLAWYDIAWHLKGNWYNCYIECPAAGYQHEQSKAPGIFLMAVTSDSTAGLPAVRAMGKARDGL